MGELFGSDNAELYKDAKSRAASIQRLAAPVHQMPSPSLGPPPAPLTPLTMSERSSYGGGNGSGSGEKEQYNSSYADYEASSYEANAYDAHSGGDHYSPPANQNYSSSPPAAMEVEEQRRVSDDVASSSSASSPVSGLNNGLNNGLEEPTKKEIFFIRTTVMSFLDAWGSFASKKAQKKFKQLRGMERARVETPFIYENHPWYVNHARAISLFYSCHISY